MGGVVGSLNGSKGPGSKYKTGNGASTKQELQEIIRNRVEEIAERNAQMRQADYPKLTPYELRGLRNKERILEEMRIQPMTANLVTTFSFTVKWEMLYQGTENQIKYFVVEVMPMAPPDEVVTFESSLEENMEESKMTIECKGSEWMALPAQILNEEDRTVYIGGITSRTPPLVFRVRARHPVGWGNWSMPSEPFQAFPEMLPKPQVEAIEGMPFAVKVGWAPASDWKPFGQVLYYKLFVRRVVRKKDPLIPVGCFASETWEEMYEGRNVVADVGCSEEEILTGFGRPLAPLFTYAFRIECATGMSRGDKRYNSLFRSKERMIKIKETVPSRLSPPKVDRVDSKSIQLSWSGPRFDGGSNILQYVVMGQRRLEDRETSPLEYYCGSDKLCVFGKDFSHGVFEADAMELTQGIEYGFSIAAVNEKGKGTPSKVTWVHIPTDEEEQAELEAKVQEELDQLATEMEITAHEYQDELMASPDGMVDLPEGWKEYWDPSTEEMFYYNIYTGENQWEHPGSQISGGGGGGGGPHIIDSNESLEDRMWRVFRKKRFRFLHELHKRAKNFGVSTKDAVKVSIRRQNLVNDSFAKLERLDSTMLFRKLQIIFEGESGIDSGGLSKDWFLEVTTSLLQPGYCLFKRTETGLYMIDQRSSLDPEAPKHFRVFGRILGKALYDQQLINTPLCHGLMKQLVGLPPELEDLKQIDPILAKSLEWMLENDITDVLEETFSITVEEFGVHREVELCERGARRNVTEKNKAKYVEAVVRWHFNGAIRSQLKHLLEGMWEVTPAKDLQQFLPEELDMLFNGKPGIDVNDLRTGCVKYSGGYDAASPTILLFWQVLEHEFSHDQRAQLLRFCTGCDKMPLDGFPPFLPFTITKSEFDKGALATAHTCFNQLVLPPYEDAQSMKEKLLMSIEHGIGFEMT